MSWRETTPQPVQDDMDDLLDAALILAEEQLTQRGEFYPFSMAIDASGDRLARSSDHRACAPDRHSTCAD
ncbi:hypothetical protein [Nocardia fluminea]|uniref:hypothetical protein n=1 Tax=Nocardia fluminea TaxID=134984 RepID=UPI0033E9B5A3